MNVVYFQPKGINPKYCEAGMISETDKEHIGKVLCAVGDFGNETFNLPQTLIRSRNLNKPPQPLLHKTRVISWLRLVSTKLKLEHETFFN